MWMEVGRTDFLREIGYRYRDLETRGIRMPVIDVRVRYKNRVMYDEVLKIKTWVSELGKVKICFSYEMLREDGTLVAEGYTMLGCLSDKYRPMAMPADVWVELEKAAKP